MDEVDGAAGERLVRRTCGWCGAWIEYCGRGRRPAYCSKAHRNRAWEVRSAARRLQADLIAGTASTEPVREVVSRPAAAPKPVKTPIRTADWVRLLGELRAQLDGELGRKFWDHERLGNAMLDALDALDRATPGGLARLRLKRL
jgi:hypothetical protein